MSHEIAAALADRLNEVAPDGVTVRASAREVEVVINGRIVGCSSAAAILDEDGAGLPEERVGTVAAAVLSAVQDEIAEALMEPWPEHNGRMLNADARQTDCRIEMWFGDEQTPGVRLRSLEVVRR